jgi:hypothetical protein
MYPLDTRSPADAGEIGKTRSRGPGALCFPLKRAAAVDVTAATTRCDGRKDAGGVLCRCDDWAFGALESPLPMWCMR